jgi:hypothetical protein
VIGGGGVQPIPDAMPIETPQQKADFEAAAKRSKPELSLNQWLLTAAIAGHTRAVDMCLSGQGAVEKPRGRGR